MLRFRRLGLNDKVIAIRAIGRRVGFMRRAARQVWFVTFPGAEVLDLAGPWAVLGHANDEVGREVYAAKLVTPLGGEVRTRHGLALGGAHSLRQALRLGSPNMLVVCGGAPSTELPPAEAALVRWLRSRQREVPRLVSICTGAFVLGEAGLLNGRRATTHWRFVDDLQRRFPKARVVNEEIFVRDGRLSTSAGITAGIDLALALVEEDHGQAVATAVARNLLLFLRRSGHQTQFSQFLSRQAGEPPRLRNLSAFVLEHLDQPLSVERMAESLNMSARTFSRWCKDDLGESPAAMVRRLRLDEARRLLSETDLPLKDLALRTGLGNPSTLWRLFTKHLGVTPADYRQRFGASPRRGTELTTRLEPSHGR
jgi:transcriptional regulator GlxA family with amidase domain